MIQTSIQLLKKTFKISKTIVKYMKKICKKVKIFHNMTLKPKNLSKIYINSLMITNINLKTSTSDAKLFRNV